MGSGHPNALSRKRERESTHSGHTSRNGIDTSNKHLENGRFYSASWRWIRITITTSGRSVIRINTSPSLRHSVPGVRSPDRRYPIRLVALGQRRKRETFSDLWCRAWVGSQLASGSHRQKRCVTSCRRRASAETGHGQRAATCSGDAVDRCSKSASTIIAIRLSKDILGSHPRSRRPLVASPIN